MRRLPALSDFTCPCIARMNWICYGCKRTIFRGERAYRIPEKFNRSYRRTIRLCSDCRLTAVDGGG